MLFAGLIWQIEKVFHVYEKLTLTNNDSTKIEIKTLKL